MLTLERALTLAAKLTLPAKLLENVWVLIGRDLWLSGANENVYSKNVLWGFANQNR